MKPKRCRKKKPTNPMEKAPRKKRKKKATAKKDKDEENTESDTKIEEPKKTEDAKAETK